MNKGFNMQHGQFNIKSSFPKQHMPFQHHIYLWQARMQRLEQRRSCWCLPFIELTLPYAYAVASRMVCCKFIK
jgi:hypothetical protein